MSDADLLQCCLPANCCELGTCCLQCCGPACCQNVKCNFSCICAIVMVIFGGVCLNYIISYYAISNQSLQTADCKKLCGDSYLVVDGLKCCQTNKTVRCLLKDNCRKKIMNESQNLAIVCMAMICFIFIGMFVLIIISCSTKDQNQTKINEHSQQKMRALLDYSSFHSSIEDYKKNSYALNENQSLQKHELNKGLKSNKIVK